MRLLLDTHYLVWAAVEPAKLTARERSLLEGDARIVTCSVVSLWELRLKWARFDASGRRKGPVDPADMRAFIASAGWTLLPVTADHAVTLLETSVDHPDPFDELLMVQAQVEGLRLLTRDAKLLDHPLAHR